MQAAAASRLPSIHASHPAHTPLAFHPAQVVPGRDGLLRLADWDTGYTKAIADVAKQGDLVDVQVMELGAGGKFRVSRKAVLLADAAADGNGDGQGGVAAAASSALQE